MNYLATRTPSLRSHGTVVVSTEADGLSEVMDLGGNVLAAIGMSTGWTDASITFLGGESSDTLRSILTSTGGEVSVVGSTASVAVSLDPSVFVGFRFIQLRSGVAATPVAQGVERSLTLYGTG